LKCEGTNSSKETGFGSKIVPFALPVASLVSDWRAIFAGFRGQNIKGEFGVQDWRERDLASRFRL